MAQEQIILDIEDALLLENYERAAMRLQDLRDQISPKEGILTSPVHRYYLSACIRTHAAAGMFDSAVKVLREALEVSGVVMAEGRVHPEVLETIETKWKPLIHKVLLKYFDFLYLLGRKNDFQQLFQECMRAEEALKPVLDVMLATDATLKDLPKPKKEPKGLVILEIEDFSETEETATVRLTLLKEDKVKVSVDDKAPQQVSLTNTTNSVTQTLTVNGKVAAITEQEQSGKSLTLKLQKAEHGTWGQLLVSLELTAPVNKNVSPEAPTSDKQLAQKHKNPYLSEKNWDRIVAEEEAQALREKDFDGTDPAMHFFREIYANADEDTRRAMMKSYQESGGKALSTNWREVKEKDYKKEFDGKGETAKE